MDILASTSSYRLPVRERSVTVKAGPNYDVTITPPPGYFIEGQTSGVLGKGGYVKLELRAGSVNYLVTAGDFTVPSVPSPQVTGTKPSTFISDFFKSVRNTALSGLNVVTGQVVVATDTVLEALGKLQGQINDLVSTGVTYEKITTINSVNTYTRATLANKTVVLATLDNSLISSPLNFTKKYASDTLTWTDSEVPLETGQVITLILNKTAPAS